MKKSFNHSSKITYLHDFKNNRNMYNCSIIYIHFTNKFIKKRPIKIFKSLKHSYQELKLDDFSRATILRTYLVKMTGPKLNPPPPSPSNSINMKMRNFLTEF